MTSKQEVVAAILQRNASAGESFLAQFSEKQLRNYLARLRESAATQREIEIDAVATPHPALVARVARASA